MCERGRAEEEETRTRGEGEQSERARERESETRETEREREREREWLKVGRERWGGWEQGSNTNQPAVVCSASEYACLSTHRQGHRRRHAHTLTH